MIAFSTIILIVFITPISLLLYIVFIRQIQIGGMSPHSYLDEDVDADSDKADGY